MGVEWVWNGMGVEWVWNGMGVEWVWRFKPNLSSGLVSRSVVLSFSQSVVVSLFRCFVVSLFRCFVVSLFRCFVVSLFRCFVVSLFHFDFASHEILNPSLKLTNRPSLCSVVCLFLFYSALLVASAFD